MKSSRRRASFRRSRTFSGIVGIAFRCFAFLALLVVGIFATRWFANYHAPLSESQLTSPSLSRSVDISVLAGPLVNGIQTRNRRVVYPYSVVPGGIASADELHEVADHDPTVAEHYQGFNYTRARVVEVTEPRLVYLSYRRGNRVFWMHKQAILRKGEKLITDGKIAARTRCGNQVSVLPQANTAPDEPLMAELDRPDAVASGMQAFPSELNSSLLSLDPGMPIGPSPASGANLGPVAGGPPGTFIPLPIGAPINSGCVPKPNKPCQNQPPPPPPPPPPPVPEPTTVLLVASGSAVVWARARSRN